MTNRKVWSVPVLVIAPPEMDSAQVQRMLARVVKTGKMALMADATRDKERDNILGSGFDVCAAEYEYREGA